MNRYTKDPPLDQKIGVESAAVRIHANEAAAEMRSEEGGWCTEPMCSQSPTDAAATKAVRRGWTASTSPTSRRKVWSDVLLLQSSNLTSPDISDRERRRVLTRQAGGRFEAVPCGLADFGIESCAGERSGLD